MITDCTTDVRGCQVFYQRGGKGEPLLLLHGLDGRPSWESVLSRLTERNDVIFPDHPGFGASSSGEWIDGMADLALFYLDVLDALQIETCHLAGHCLGGWLAAEIAVMQPQRIRSLSLCSAAGIRVDGSPMGDAFLWNPEETLCHLVVSQQARETMRAKQSSEGDLEFLLKARQMAARLAWYPRFHNPHLRKWLHRLTMPTLIQWGDSDRLFPEVYAHRYHEMIPHSQLKIYTDCGHIPMLDAPDLWLEDLKDFMARASA
ncbi:alpha/beta fold hydrolase [Cyanobium sp. Lug-B]|uniref:alpha/beta fold hydrolase n=1 Tax=Cyanobium sp. Lug-B TaxID=2823716 RepID=UPI0020CC8A87|nr:alpha/beta hydrolase [Cyanobium sp. Lug-B]MCP9796680.1 alpha/beta hydrolase [Cyanobium sp. Lug-B]